MAKDLEKQTVLVLKREWELDSSLPSIQPEEVVEQLRVRIKDWLENDFEKLVNAFYKLDVAEEKFHAAMRLSDSNQIATQLANLVWERELQRAFFRNKYS